MMAQLLEDAGYVRGEDALSSDVCIINSCTVTAVSDAKCRKLIHRIRRENPSCIIVLTGCMPQAFPDDSILFEGCDIVLGNTLRKQIVPALYEYLQTRERILLIRQHEKDERFEPMELHSFCERTRAFIKIEDGCNRFCTYCIIPYARGRVRSKSVEDIQKEAEALAQNGFRELVLVGINLSAYGQDIDSDICAAVKAVCDVDGIDRVRLGSIEPERMTRETLLTLSKEKKFCPHFHLSLQSGCDETLKRMKRHYTADEYRAIVKNIREIFENPSITTDIMVGFAGESDEEFVSSLRFVDDIGFARAHVFSYSRRKGTKADLMDDQVPESVKNERSRIMIRHTDEKQREFLCSQTSRILPVLFETIDRDGFFEGYTMNYVKVKVKSDEDLSNRIIDVELTNACDDYCEGVLR